MKISFDYDCTLGEKIIQKLVAFLLLTDAEIYVITARNFGMDHNRDLYNICKRLGIPDERIFFTEGAFKWRKIKELGIVMHFDDVPEECELIIKNTTCLPLLLWDEVCSASIKSDQFGKGIY